MLALFLVVLTISPPDAGSVLVGLGSGDAPSPTLSFSAHMFRDLTVRFKYPVALGPATRRGGTIFFKKPAGAPSFASTAYAINISIESGPFEVVARENSFEQVSENDDSLYKPGDGFKKGDWVLMGRQGHAGTVTEYRSSKVHAIYGDTAIGCHDDKLGQEALCNSFRAVLEFGGKIFVLSPPWDWKTSAIGPAVLKVIIESFEILPSR